MALAKTNASAYSVEKKEGDIYSIATGVTVLGTGTVEGAADHGGISLVTVDGILYRKQADTDYLQSDAGFEVHDVIFADSINKFIAVGKGIATSPDGQDWTAVSGLAYDLTDLYDDTNKRNAAISYLFKVAEMKGNIYIIGVHWKNVSETITPNYKHFYMCLKISISGSSCTSENVVGDNLISASVSTESVVPISRMNRAMVENNRVIIIDDPGNISNRSVYVISGGTCKRAAYMPMNIMDGYFIAIDSYHVLRSVNGIDYTKVGDYHTEPSAIIKQDGFYYIFTQNRVCRGKTLSEAVGKTADEHVALDSGENIPFSDIKVVDGKMTLLCNGYIISLIINGDNNPVVQTIKTLSAAEALKMAKTYTDEQIKAIIERISELEDSMGLKEI